MLQRLFILAATAHADRQRQGFRRDVQCAAKVQSDLLLRLVHRHAPSEFGRIHDFSRMRDPRDFARCVPIRNHEQLFPWLNRVFQGDATALFRPNQSILMFALSSGTTDQPKRIPVTPEFLRSYRRGWNVFGIQALHDHPEGLGRCLLQVVSPMEEYRSPTGVPCGAISGLLAARQMRVVRRYYANPPITANMADANARYYTIMRLAVPRDVAWVVTPNPATTLRLVKTAADHAERLVRDIHDGTLSPPGEVEIPIRARTERALRPNPALARKLTAEIARDGRLLPRHYWRLSFLANWMGGTLRLYLQDFPAWFGEVPVRDIGLLATEGRVTIPLEDGSPVGVLDPHAGYFEFLEENSRAEDFPAVRAGHELEVGRGYRVVMTNAAGLYRYDLGDYVRVHGFLGESPCLEFLHRGDAVSSLCGEKLTEWQVLTAFERVARQAGCAAARFVVAPMWGDPPYYRLYVENRVSFPCTFGPDYDAALATLNVEYASKRASRRLGGVEVNVMPPGLLQACDEHRARARGRGHEQFKQSHLLTSPGADTEFLLGGDRSALVPSGASVSEPRP